MTCSLCGRATTPNPNFKKEVRVPIKKIKALPNQSFSGLDVDDDDGPTGPNLR
jgi:hypothetical protein